MCHRVCGFVISAVFISICVSIISCYYGATRHRLMYKNDNVSFSPFSLRFGNVYSIPINNTKSNKKRNDATAAATTRLFTARIITLLPSCLYLAAFTAAIIVFALPRKGSIITTLLSLILLNRTEVQNTILVLFIDMFQVEIRRKREL